MPRWNGTGPGRRGRRPLQSENGLIGDCLARCTDAREDGQALCDPCESRWDFHYGIGIHDDRPVLIRPAKECE